MSTLAMLLSRFIRQPVQDRTGLEGMYELKLDWIPENRSEAYGILLDAA